MTQRHFQLSDHQSDPSVPARALTRADLFVREQSPGAIFGAATRAPQAAYEFVSAAEFAHAQDLSDLELAHVQAHEVTIAWGDTVVHVAHVTEAREYFVGESRAAGQPGTSVTGARRAVPCGYLLPAEKLGCELLPLLLVENGAQLAVIPHNAGGYLRTARAEHVPLDAVRAQSAPTLRHAGAHLIALEPGARLHLTLADLVIEIAPVAAGKPSARGAGFDRSVLSYFGLTLGAHAALLSAFGFFVPPLGLNDEEGLDRDKLYVMQQYLDAAAEREHEQQQTEASNAATEEGGTGERAQGAEGALGKPTSHATNARYAVKGPHDNPDPHLARAAALADAATFGVVGLLNAGLAGDPNAPTSLFGRDSSLGRDDLSANGNMWGATLGEAFGGGGLGLSGYEEGGGGHGLGVGVGDLGTIGHGSGLGPGQGFGNGPGGMASSRGLSNGTHVTRTPRIASSPATVSGRLPPEVIQRIVRQNFGRFRMCYAQGVTRNPNLAGRVSARFVIGRDGSVSNVANGGSDLPDSAVVSCVVSAFYGLSFPAPDNGIVSVVYPISFTPG